MVAATEAPAAVSPDTLRKERRENFITPPV
jgi:hypothetical protein